MQHLLILHQDARRRCHRRHRVHALTALSCQQAETIMTQRTRPVRMPDDARQRFEVRREAIYSIRYCVETHTSPPLLCVSATP